MFKSGYVGIIGRTNAGKSTLLNRLLGQKVAIVTPVPQTTRKRILGILSLPEAQVLLVDTPGIQKGKSLLNKEMLRKAVEAVKDVDLVWMMTALPKGERALLLEREKEEDLTVLGIVKKVGIRSMLVINKIDAIEKPLLLPFIEEMKALHSFDDFIPISALTGEGVDVLIRETVGMLSEGPKYYENGAVTDQLERDIAAEIIREKVMLATRQEVPHAVAVTIEQWKDPEREGKVTRIEATLHVERNSQKGILIGRGGAMLKEIGTNARAEIERILERRVYLGLFVRVEKDWRSSESSLRKLGFK